MRIPRIYVTGSLNINAIVELPAAPSLHVAKVLRMKPGSELVVFNGEGGQYNAQITAVDRSRVFIRPTEFHAVETESPLKLRLYQGISKGERMDFTIQKSVELGISGIVPVFTEHCDVKLSGERLDKRQQHWSAVAVSACEQCGRNRVPVVYPAVSFSDALSAAGDQEDLKLILDHRANETLHRQTSTPASVGLFAGPEGGFSQAEHALARQHGWLGLRMGPRVLRTETAALVALAMLQERWGDLG